MGGHSKGGVIASQLAADYGSAVNGLLLIGTSHPRDVDLHRIPMAVTKIVGTRDGLATPEKVQRNERLLPPQTRWVWIEGGNHSQFGWYGFQPMDRRPRIRASEQRRIMIEAVLELMRSVSPAQGDSLGGMPSGAAPGPLSCRSESTVQSGQSILSYSRLVSERPFRTPMVRPPLHDFHGSKALGLPSESLKEMLPQ